MHHNYHIMYIFVGNKNILARTKIYGSNIQNNLMLHRNNKMVSTGVNGHNLHIKRNDHWCCGRKHKNWSSQTFHLCIHQQLKYMLY
jgi:hypothetical protein